MYFNLAEQPLGMVHKEPTEVRASIFSVDILFFFPSLINLYSCNWVETRFDGWVFLCCGAKVCMKWPCSRDKKGKIQNIDSAWCIPVIYWNNTGVWINKYHGEILMLIPAMKEIIKTRYDNKRTNDLESGKTGICEIERWIWQCLFATLHQLLACCLLPHYLLNAIISSNCISHYICWEAVVDHKKPITASLVTHPLVIVHFKIPFIITLSWKKHRTLFVKIIHLPYLHVVSEGKGKTYLSTLCTHPQTQRYIRLVLIWDQTVTMHLLIVNQTVEHDIPFCLETL